MTEKPTAGLSTLSVWAGGESLHANNATQVPVVHSVSYGYKDLDQWLDVALGKKRAISTVATPIPPLRYLRKKSVCWKVPRPRQVQQQEWA